MVKLNRYFLVIICFLILFPGCTSKFEKAQREKQEAVAINVSEKIASNLSSLINFLCESLHEPADINSQNFQNLSQKYPELAALFLYDSELELQGKFPADVSNDDIIENCLTNQNKREISSIKKPVIGHSLLIIDTHVFIGITIPLYAPSKKNPYLSIVLINTEIFFSRIEREYIAPYPYSLIVINDQQDVVYDSDPMRIGKDFLTKMNSSEYDVALKNLYNIMMENAQDYFITNIEEQTKSLRKIFVWNMINVYNEVFYVTLVRNLVKSTNKKFENVYLLSTLRSYAIQDTLIDPIIDKQPEEIERLLKHIYEQNPDVYSVLLADVSGTIISGWPLCNSSIGYRTDQNLNKSFDTALEQVMISKQEKIIHAPLFEGGEGRIIFIPVLVHEDMYGVLIAIEPQGN